MRQEEKGGLERESKSEARDRPHTNETRHGGLPHYRNESPDVYIPPLRGSA